MEPILIEGLTKRYGPVLAVDDLSFSVPAGRVTGFLGPNGAGKTTTLRILLGLVHPTTGSATINGVGYADLPDPARTVGAVLEATSFHPGRRARDHLRILATAAGIPQSRVDETLDRVGLADDAHRRVGGFSLGMRQRLGLAAALLKDPELLVLDEPANGLDPAGIREVRQLLRRLGQEGRTVFVSSHLLTEVEQTCDAVAILSRGRCVAAGSVRDVLAGSRSGHVLARVNDPAAALAVLARAGFGAERVEAHVRVAVAPERASEVTRVLGSAGLWLSELRAEEITLEELFLELTSERSSTDDDRSKEEVAA